MKPLVLTWHPKLEDTNLSAYDIHEGRKTERRLRLAKRLTDAELAAEVWHSISLFSILSPSPEAVTEASRNRTIERFATLPHYDEVTE